MRPPSTDVYPLYLEVPPAEIAAIKFLFESYEEVAVMRTLDRHIAIIVVLVVPDFLEVARQILASLQQDFPCREIPRPPLAADDWLLRELDA